MVPATLGGSNPSKHVYELRMYQVNEGKMEALIARFGDHTDAIFKRHNMKSVAIGVPKMRRTRKVSLSISSNIRHVRKPQELGSLSSPIRNGKR